MIKIHNIKISRQILKNKHNNIKEAKEINRKERNKELILLLIDMAKLKNNTILNYIISLF